MENMGRKEKNKLILVDGSAMTYRSYYAFINNPLRDSKGENISAIFGMANSLLKILREQNFTHIAVCFDTPKPTFRHRLFKEYKATREKMPDELAGQLAVVKELIEALGIPVIEEEGFEADDVMGTLAILALSEKFTVTLISFDKDFLQLLTQDGIDIIKPGRGKITEEIITKEDVNKKFGVTAAQITDYLALIGDTSDNVPGVPGVGPKSAVKLLKDFGTIENIIFNKSNITSERIRLAINEKQLSLSKKLVTIDTNVNLEITVKAMFYRGKNNERLKELFTELEFTSLMGEIDEKPEKLVKFEEIGLEQTGEITKGIEEKAAIEFLDTNGSFYLSIAVTDNVWITNVFREESLYNESIQTFLRKNKVLKISSDVKSLLHLFEVEDVNTGKGFFDISIASYLLEPSRGSHTMEFVSLRFANRTLSKKIDMIKGFKKEKIGIGEVKQELARYVQTDLDLYPVLISKLKEEGLDDLFYNLEMPLISVLARIEKAGIALNEKLFRNLSTEYNKEISEIEKNIYSIAGETFNVRSTKQLQHILFEKLKLKPPRRTKTGFSTDSDTLMILTESHDLPKEILKYRELYKLKSTYIDTLPELIGKDGRIHTTLIQTTTSTGRLASRNPNLQNIPARGDQGREIRKGFIAPRGKKLLSFDYSQIELRVLAHISDDENLKNAFYNELDIHTRTASGIFRIPEENITREMRRRAKVINFGIIYGMSPFGLAQELNITPEDGMVIINAYFNTYPDVKKWIDRIIEETENKGYTETLLGRRRKVPELVSDNYNTKEFGKRIAINTPVQGSAADIIKLAMIRIDERLRKESIDATMILQIHDELLFEADASCLDEAKALIVDEMENAVKLSVPLKVEVGVGNNWYEAH